MSDMLSGSRAAGSPGEGELAVTQVAGAVMPAALHPRRRRRAGDGDFLHYALHNSKLVFGLGLELLFVLAAIFGPFISPHDTTEFFLPHQPPSAQHWMGTDYFGHDVFAQLVNGLRRATWWERSARCARRWSAWPSASPRATAADCSTRCCRCSPTSWS